MTAGGLTRLMTDACRRPARPGQCDCRLVVQRAGGGSASLGGSTGRTPRRSRAGRRQAERNGPEQRAFGAARRQLDADARRMLDHTRADLDEALTDCRELGRGQTARRRYCRAHAVHQPECGRVQHETHLVGGRAVAAHAVGRQLRLVQLDQVLHLPALAIDVLVEVLRAAFERGGDVADVDLLPAVARLPRVGLARALDARDHAPRPRPAPRLVLQARVAAQLFLRADGVPEAQVIASLFNHGIQHAVAGQAEDEGLAIVLAPCHHLVAAIVAVAAPDQTRSRPVPLEAPGDVLDDGPHLRTLRRARGPQDRADGRAALDVIDMHGGEAALVLVRIPERELLAAVRRTERIVDVDDLLPARLHGYAELIDQRAAETRSLDLARRVLEAAVGRLRRERRVGLGTPAD